MDQYDHQKVKYFGEVLGIKYHLGYPGETPDPPRHLQGGGGPMGGPGGQEWGGGYNVSDP